MESCLAFSTKPQVLTTTTSAPSPSVVTCQPSACSRAASSSESTSLRAQPRVSRATRRPSGEEEEVADTIRGYRAAGRGPATAGRRIGRLTPATGQTAAAPTRTSRSRRKTSVPARPVEQKTETWSAPVRPGTAPASTAPRSRSRPAYGSTAASIGGE